MERITTQTMTLRSKGQFATRKQYALTALLLALKETKKVRWVKCIALSYLIAWPLALFIDIHEPTPIEYARAEEIATSTPPVPVVIEVTYTKERTKELIAEAFPDAPIMLRVAACESGFLQHAYNPTNNSHDGGVFQISQKYHGARMQKLGLDPYDVKDNIAYARILYNESGLQPWLASKHCWSR